MTPAGTSNELDVQNEWEENTRTRTRVFRQHTSLLVIWKTCIFQERRARENAIEAAKKAVQAAATEGRKPDPMDESLAAQEIAKDETEGQSSQDCEVTYATLAL